MLMEINKQIQESAVRTKLAKSEKYLRKQNEQISLRLKEIFQINIHEPILI